VEQMFRDPRWRLEVADGRRTLAKESRRYDIIESDAILPEASHSGLLYSAEFLAQVRGRLAPGGLYVQWAPTERSVETFAAVFPHTILLLPAGVLIGSDDPIPFDRERLIRAFRDPATAEHLRRGNKAFSDWASLFAEPPIIWSPASLRAEPPLTDVFPRDEFYLNNPVVTTDIFVRRVRPVVAHGAESR